MNIGPFEILSELAKSPTGSVYKANDPETGQTIALKAIRLSAFGESATALEQALLAEAESTKVLSSPNITSVYGAGEIEGQFCAAMDYIQGNSIATMLARKEGFSIWDLLDIGRQLTSGLDHAAAHNVVHYSLEPAKIMCGWDGTVKILSFGVSVVGNFVQHIPEGVPAVLYYMSPEQILGQPMDERSNLFSLGAMFYEMVTERKAFDREDAESLRQCILGATPVAPAQVNPKVHPLLSDLIMKALSKDPAERYQTGRALLDDLEKCKESKPLAAKKPQAPKGAAVPGQVKAAAQSKFVAPAATASGLNKPAAKAQSATPSGLARPSVLATPQSRPAELKTALAKPAERKTEAPGSAESWQSTLAQPSSKLAAPKAAAAAAGAGSSDAAQVSGEEVDLDLSGVAAPGMPATQSPEAPSAYMSSSAVADEPQVEPQAEPQAEEASKITVDPMMAEGGAAGASGTSFSDLDELPPLKEVYIAPPPPPPAPGFEPAAGAPATPTVFRGSSRRDEKPKVQPREVAEKAIEEIKNVPPKLMLYALAAAGALIVAIGIGVTVYIHNLGSEDDAGAGRTATAAEAPAQTEASQPAPQPTPQPTPKAAAPPAAAPQPEETSEPEAPAAQPAASARSARGRKKAPAPAPMIIPGQLSVDSTPQGAQVQIDGRTEPTWLTPFAFSNLQPGQHSITVSKPGYSTDTRAVMGISGNKVTVIAHLSQLMATLVVKSDPPGANIYVDGRDVGAKTPAQVSVDKGQHVVLVRMMGYIDETMNGQFALGQTFNFAPTLRPLGNVDSIKTVGKMSKLFGGKAQPGQGVVSIHTQPKGAQVAINQHLLEKNSPVDVALDPGNYVIDITLTGYAPLHRVITAEKGDKVVVDEVLQPQ
ncbi:MAG: PEGA domain-containing protein [Candidatus Sulfotelmatobacter sp.]